MVNVSNNTEITNSISHMVKLYHMSKVLAISGGVDSMVMLDICRQHFAPDELIVAHFDHGIRENSAEDAKFVQRKAKEYGLECQVGRGNLGAKTSEVEAREARYDFLRSVAKEQGGAEIWTAHHLDDLVESVVINFLRGTGWRGLAALDAPGMRRPFLETEIIYEPLDKMAIFEYAAKRGLEFREDPSNSWDEYLRNRIRHQMNNDDAGSGLDFEQKMEIYRLWLEQKELKREIDKAVNTLIPSAGNKWQRAWFRELDPKVALELLRTGTLRTGIQATRPQLEDFRQAILNYAPSKYFNLPGDRLVKLNKIDFEI